MVWTTRIIPAIKSFFWDELNTFWDEEDVHWDSLGWADRPEVTTSWGDERGVSCFFSQNYYPFKDTGHPFEKVCQTDISTTWTIRT